MLSKHPGRCRFPHGHTRKIEVIVSSASLDRSDMVVDFKALKLAVAGYIERFDHSMAINSADPTLEALQKLHPESLIIFENTDPTTEVIARDLFDYVSCTLKNGFSESDANGDTYSIKPNTVLLERVRVWETPTSWAEYGT